MDEFDDEIAVGFSGNGYLSFWTRCRRAAEALPNGLRYAAGGRCVITDTFMGEEKNSDLDIVTFSSDSLRMFLYAGYMECTVHLLAGMPVCYIYRQQEGRQAELPKGRRDFKMATLDVTEERRRAIDRVNRAYADEDYDRYERLIERYCHRFGFDGDYGLFEDACTDARLFGH